MAIKRIDVALCGLLFAEGFILMGFEMLASRFLNPYFGSTIDTWACIISVVLVAMALGYFVGGYLSNKPRAHLVLPIVTVLSGLYLISIAYLSKPVLMEISGSLGSGFYPTFLSAVVLMAVPVFLMSFWSPIVIGLLARTSTRGATVAGYVYGLSTVGNVCGTLVTAFVLVPSFGSISIALMFGVALLVIALLYVVLCLRPFEIASACWVAFGTLALLAAPATSKAEPTEILPARYPEGVLIVAKGEFFFAEMTADSVSFVIDGQREATYELPGCGPTGVTKIAEMTLAIACHRSGTVAILSLQDGQIRTIGSAVDGLRFRNPNDINADGEGGAFFSDPGPFSPSAGKVGRVFRLDRNLDVHLVSSGLTYPNGVAFDRASRILFVSEHLKRRIVAISLNEDFVAKEPPEIYHDFLLDPISSMWSPLSGPDGLRITENGNIAVAIYGGGGVAIVGSCGLLAWLEGFPEFTTSVGVSDGRMIAVGAHSNSAYPFWGSVMSTNIGELADCAELKE
jgi:sugar lactone lactonase YvrE